MRYGLSYQQAALNSGALSNAAYHKAIEEGKTIEQAQKIAREAFEKEMQWYES